jgi:hypothetical protein
MDLSGRVAPLVIQALCHLGKNSVTPEVISRLRSTLSKMDKAELKRNLRYTAAWMKSVIEQIASEETS